MCRMKLEFYGDLSKFAPPAITSESSGDSGQKLYLAGGD